ncbi:YceD family protein [Marinicrinis lubricantis]|uniref:YceD family protein n=1 Tax=Marinicrinis lubricantis TaxID=2086470 RepID=A0ABW1IMJ6_9BACL
MINVRELSAKPIPQKIQTSIPLQNLVKDDKDIVKAEPLNLDLQAVAKEGVITVSGRCNADVDFICARTLVQFTEEIAFDVHLAFTTFQTHAMKDEDMEYIPGETFDLVPFLEEQFLLSLPFIPVCKEVKDQEAQRLLEKYVRDPVEEEQASEASTNHIDPRLAGLKKFFDKKE